MILRFFLILFDEEERTILFLGEIIDLSVRRLGFIVGQGLAPAANI